VIQPVKEIKQENFQPLVQQNCMTMYNTPTYPINNNQITKTWPSASQYQPKLNQELSNLESNLLPVYNSNNIVCNFNSNDSNQNFLNNNRQIQLNNNNNDNFNLTNDLNIDIDNLGSDFFDKFFKN